MAQSPLRQSWPSLMSSQGDRDAQRRQVAESLSWRSRGRRSRRRRRPGSGRRASRCPVAPDSWSSLAITVAGRGVDGDEPVADAAGCRSSETSQASWCRALRRSRARRVGGAAARAADGREADGDAWRPRDGGSPGPRARCTDLSNRSSAGAAGSVEDDRSGAGHGDPADLLVVAAAHGAARQRVGVGPLELAAGAVGAASSAACAAAPGGRQAASAAPTAKSHQLLACTLIALLAPARLPANSQTSSGYRPSQSRLAQTSTTTGRTIGRRRSRS